MPGSQLTNSRRWRGQRFGLAARHEEGASPHGGCDRRITKWPAQRSAALFRFPRISCFIFASFSHHTIAAAGICELASIMPHQIRPRQRFDALSSDINMRSSPGCKGKARHSVRAAFPLPQPPTLNPQLAYKREINHLRQPRRENVRKGGLPRPAQAARSGKNHLPKWEKAVATPHSARLGPCLPATP